MSARIAYLSRADRGARLTGVRLLGPHADDSWDGTPSLDADPVSDAASAARGAGRWIAQRLAERKGASLSAVCLDPDGAACAWVATPTADLTAISTLARQGPIADELVPGAITTETPINYFAESTQDSQVQGLVAPEAPRSKVARAPDRVGVLAVGDLAARLLVDELDTAGVPVDQITTLYHLLASAWDPSSAIPGPTDSDAVVAESSPTTAVILIEPTGRLVWSWSRRGNLLAGGTIRLAMIRPEIPEPTPETPAEPVAPRLAVHESDISRLCAEWLAWSVQLGVAPDRAVCLFPESATMVETEAGVEPTAQLLGRRWGNMPVDAAVHDDPVGATLLRVLSREEDRGSLAADPRTGLTLLSHRPTRAHQKLYMWAAGTILVVAAGLSIAAWRIHAAASTARAAADQFRAKIDTMVQEVHPPAKISPAGVALALRQELNTLQKKFAPPDKPDPTQPILEELDALSSVLGVPDIELTEITLNNTAVTVKVVTPDLPTAELVLEALRNVGGSHVSTWNQQFTQQPNQKEGGKVNATFNGLWAAPERSKPATGGPS